MKKQNITIQHRKEIKMYIKPEIIKLTNEQILSYIKAYADSSFGCPGASADYVVGGGCGHAYKIGACDIKHNT